MQKNPVRIHKQKFVQVETAVVDTGHRLGVLVFKAKISTGYS